MKTFEELLAENNAMATRVEKLTADLAALQTRANDETKLAGLDAKLTALEAKLSALETKDAALDAMAAKIEATGTRVVALESAKADFDRHVAAQVARLGISIVPIAPPPKSEQSPEALLAAYQAEADPVKAGRLYQQWREATGHKAAA